MLCELSVWGNFWVTWAAISVLAFFSLMFFSGIVFYFYYVNPTYETWKTKSNPKYPDAVKVREENFDDVERIMFRCILSSIISLSL